MGRLVARGALAAALIVSLALATEWVERGRVRSVGATETTASRPGRASPSRADDQLETTAAAREERVTRGDADPR